MASMATSQTWQSQLHALLQVLNPKARRQVIEQWMSKSQRTYLEQWVLASLKKQSAHAVVRPDVDTESSSAVKSPGDELTYTSVAAQSRNITKAGDLHVPSVYIRWLEIVGPARKEYDHAACDQFMLSDVESCLSCSVCDVSAESYDWSAIEDVIRNHGHEPALLRARVILPTGFWLGTRIATPRVGLKDALEIWRELRSHPMWQWWGAAHAEGQPFQPRFVGLATLQDLWASFRSDYIRASVRAGVKRSHVDARLSRLEERHHRTYGSLEDVVLNRVAQVLWRQTSQLQRMRLKEFNAQKRKRRIEECQRRGALRRRLLEEKCLTMAEILGRRSQ